MHPELHQLFEKLKANLMSLLLKHTLHPSILTAYWLRLVSICHVTPYPNDFHELSPALKTAVHYQDHLGWLQLLHSQMTKHWVSAIDQLNPQLATSGIQIMTKLTQTVWAYILAMWLVQNQHLHNDASNFSLPNYQQVVHTLYEWRDQLDPDAQDALFR